MSTAKKSLVTLMAAAIVTTVSLAPSSALGMGYSSIQYQYTAQDDGGGGGGGGGGSVTPSPLLVMLVTLLFL